MLLRMAHRTRESDPIEFKRIAGRILELESWTVKQMVQTAGFRQTGNRWVDPSELDDVVSMALTRMLDHLTKRDGQSIGQWRNAVKTCVRFAVADYVRYDQRHEAEPIDHGHFTDALAPDEQKYAEITSLAATGSAEDGVLFKEQLGLVTELEPRAADVIRLRLIVGLSAKEVAEQLGLSSVNVDQILSRSVRKLARLGK